MKTTSSTPPRIDIETLVLHLALAGSLVVLIWHVSIYWFVTDDAFISFRYAKNWSDGFGLTFNPGLEPVEGYTNFLWVALLALGAWLGFAPEISANVLSFGLTLALWGAIVWFVNRQHGADPHRWLILFPALLLACCRSYAVWATGGLETRLFEALVTVGVMRWIVEWENPEHSGQPYSAALFALATLTRPDGLLLFFCALGAFGFERWTRVRHAAWRPIAERVAIYAPIVGAHHVFRRLYYGEWLPNTYFAKVGDPWWSMGGRYLAQFAIEYGMLLWVPLLVAGVVWHFKRRTWLVPLLYAAIVAPHAAFIARIGGDHFEYRPLDLYLPLCFLTMYDGAKALATTRRRLTACAIYCIAVVATMIALPLQLHREYPVDEYRGGFPGSWAGMGRAFAVYPDVSRNLLYRWPGLRTLGEVYREWLQSATRQFVGIRQEEHGLFVQTVIEEGRLLKKWIDAGLIPHDVQLGINSVGAVSYLTGLRTFDRHGLTDKEVARLPTIGERVMAHEKMATLELARSKGVDLWAVHGVHLALPVTDPTFVESLWREYSKKSNAVIAPVDETHYLIARAPQGIEAVQARLPKLQFRSVRDQSAVVAAMQTALNEAVRQEREAPSDPRPRLLQAQVLEFAGEMDAAKAKYREMIDSGIETAEVYTRLGVAWAASGSFDEARIYLRKALAMDAPPSRAGLRLGDTYSLQGRLQEAADAYRHVLQEVPEQPGARLSLARTYLQQERPAAAMEELNALLKRHPSHPEAIVLLGDAYRAQGRPGDAEQEYRRALSIRPGFEDATSRLDALLEARSRQ